MSSSVGNPQTSRHDRCAQEQVHLIGRIQPHGVLFALSEQDLRVQFVSSNVADFFNAATEQVLGQSFEFVIGSGQFEGFQRKCEGLIGGSSGLMPVTISARGAETEMDCVFHRRNGLILVEMAPHLGAHSLGLLSLDTHLRGPLLRLEDAEGIADLVERAATEIHRLSGYDRVMVYRFDEEWVGEVIAEVSRPSPVSYLGLRFPASDIPPQARSLFLINSTRTIVDVGAVAVPIVPDLSPDTGRALDLTCSLLRSASPVHLEYLRNMGVAASMTVSVVVSGRLWGMIACHHPSPLRVDYATRSVCELIGKMLGSQVELRIDNDLLQTRLKARKLLDEYLESIKESKTLSEAIESQSTELLGLFNADGFIASIGGETLSCGRTIQTTPLSQLVEAFRLSTSSGVASSNRLNDLAPAASTADADMCGALYIQLGNQTDSITFLLKELTETVTWAGDPGHTVSEDEQEQLHPRSSFAAWSEVVRGRSRNWTEIEIELAALLRDRLMQMNDRQRLAVAHEALGKEVQERKRAEKALLQAQKLEAVGQLAAGIAHEINTPTQYIGDNVRFLKDAFNDLTYVVRLYEEGLSTGSSETIDSDKIDKVKVEVASVDIDYMMKEVPKAIEQTLEGVSRVAEIVNAMKAFTDPNVNEPVLLNLNDAILSMITVARNEWRYVAELSTDLDPDLPRYLCHPGEFNQAILNLLVNAAHSICDKYDGGHNGKGLITVRTRNGPTGIEIRIQDTGAGIPEQVRERIFDPFFTTRDIGKGTGQGLTVARSAIVDRHKGTLEFETETGAGTTFIIRLPHEKDPDQKERIQREPMHEDPMHKDPMHEEAHLIA